MRRTFRRESRGIERSRPATSRSGSSCSAGTFLPGPPQIIGPRFLWQLLAWWHVANVNAVARLRINDHSWVHVQIVANIALKLLRQLTKHHVEPSVVTDYGYDPDDAEVVVLLGALLHCVGMAIHRDGHEDFSLFMAEPKQRELLKGLYEEPELTVIASE